MGCINKAAISGNLTRDPELRQTQGGQQVLQISIACNESRKFQSPRPVRGAPPCRAIRTTP